MGLGLCRGLHGEWPLENVLWFPSGPRRHLLHALFWGLTPKCYLDIIKLDFCDIYAGRFFRFQLHFILIFLLVLADVWLFITMVDSYSDLSHLFPQVAAT